MPGTKLSALTELAASPADDDEVYIRDISEPAADESKRIVMSNLLGSLPATTLNGTLTLASGIQIISAVTNSTLIIRGGQAVAGGGAVLHLTGVDNANTGRFLFENPNAAGSSSLNRLVISGKVTIAVATWSNITHTGIVLSGALDFNSQALNNLGSLDATSQGVIEATIDTLANLTSIQGQTVTLAGAFITSGAYSLTLTQTAATNVTLPTTGTLATLAGTEELTNKTLNASVLKGTFTASGTVTFPAFTLNGTVILNGQVFDAGSGELQVITTSALRGIKIQSNNDSGGAAILDLYHNSASPAVEDTLGFIKFFGNTLASNGNPADTEILMADIQCLMVSVIDEAEEAALGWHLMNGGTLNTVMELYAGGSLILDEGILLEGAQSDGKYNGTTEPGVAGTALAFGDLVYLAVADSRWELTDADAEATAFGKIGICVLAANEDAATVILLWGKVRADAAFPALTIGAPVHVGTTPGDIQVAAPTGTGDIVRVIGYGNTADELYFCPDNTYVEVA